MQTFKVSVQSGEGDKVWEVRGYPCRIMGRDAFIHKSPTTYRERGIWAITELTCGYSFAFGHSVQQAWTNTLVNLMKHSAAQVDKLIAEHIAKTGVMNPPQYPPEEWATFYTSAPKDYDGFGTRRLYVVGLTVQGHHEMWKVVTPREHADWQRNRYQSGLYESLDDKGLADLAGLVWTNTELVPPDALTAGWKCWYCDDPVTQQCLTMAHPVCETHSRSHLCTDKFHGEREH